MTSSISHLRLRRWNTTLSKKKPKKNQAESNFFGGFFVNCPKSVGRFLVSYCAFIVALLLWPLCWLVSSDPYALLWEHWPRWHACRKTPSVGWRCLASAASCFFFFFVGGFCRFFFWNFYWKPETQVFPGFSIVWGWKLWFLDWVCLRNGGMGMIQIHGNSGTSRKVTWNTACNMLVKVTAWGAAMW